MLCTTIKLTVSRDRWHLAPVTAATEKGERGAEWDRQGSVISNTKVILVPHINAEGTKDFWIKVPKEGEMGSLEPGTDYRLQFVDPINQTRVSIPKITGYNRKRR